MDKFIDRNGKQVLMFFYQDGESPKLGNNCGTHLLIYSFNAVPFVSTLDLRVFICV